MSYSDQDGYHLEERVRLLTTRVRELEAIVARIPRSVLLEPHEAPAPVQPGGATPKEIK